MNSTQLKKTVKPQLTFGKKLCCITAVLFSVSTFCLGQLPDAQEKENNYKWAFSASINSVEAQIDQPLITSWDWAYQNLTVFGNRKDKSVSFGITPKYSLNDNVQLRCELGMTNIYLTSHYDGINDSNTTFPNGLIKNDTIQQKIFRFIPGIQWKFMKKKFIESYCGLSADYIYYGKMSWEDNLKPNSNNSTPTGYDRWIGTTQGGFATGIGAFVGFNIYLQKLISMGSEFSSALLYYKIGGVQSGERVTLDPPNPILKRDWSISDNVAKGFQFSKIMASLNITLHF